MLTENGPSMRFLDSVINDARPFQKWYERVTICLSIREIPRSRLEWQPISKGTRPGSGG